jgi:hypothetical protein
MERRTEMVWGLALMGGFLVVGCGDRQSMTGSIDPGSPAGAGGAALPGGGAGTGAAGNGGAPGTGGAPGIGGRVSPPPPETAARLIAPLSGSLLSTNQPTFHFQPAAGGGALTIDVCADRACTQIVQQIDATGSSATAPSPLAAGHVFWRARGASSTSATWEAFIPHRTTTLSAALATRPDYDGDGFGDFALDDRVILGGPNGYERSFPLPGPTPAADVTVFVQAGDLDGDGFGDILRLDGSDAVTPFGIFTPTPLLGGPTGFTIGAAVTTAQPAGSFYDTGPAGDVNGDGYADFLFKTRFDILTYLGGAAAITDGQPPAAHGTQSFFAFGADYDGDGFADATSMTNGESTLEVTRGGPGGFDRTMVATITTPEQPKVGALATIDANGDGYADLATELESGGLAIFAGSAQGLSPTPVQTIALASSCQACSFIAPIGTGDFNGDGLPDLVTQEGPGPANVPVFAVHFGTATGFDPAATNLALPDDARASADSISDVNGDGFEDLTVARLDTIDNPDGSVSYRALRFMLLYGGPGGLTPAP